MTIYYPHFRYNSSADDAYYYGGVDWKKYLHREDAVAEAERVMHAQWEDDWSNLPSDFTNIDGYFIFEEEVY